MLTQLSTLKARLGLEIFDTTDDATLTNLLRHVSARFAAECNRTFDFGAGVTNEFRADQINVVVDHPPIELISQFDLKSSESEGWILQSGVEYLLSPQKSLIELAQPLGSVRQLGRVTYTGGYVLPGAAPTGNQIALPDALEQGCIEQVAYWYSRRTQLGLLSVSSDAGIVQQFQSTDLLPQVRATLNIMKDGLTDRLAGTNGRTIERFTPTRLFAPIRTFIVDFNQHLTIIGHYIKQMRAGGE